MEARPVILETKVIVGMTTLGLLIAQLEAAPLGDWSGLGISGALAFILFWVVAKRDPEVAKINAEATQKAAEIHAAASRYAAETLQAAIATQTQQINAQHQQTQAVLAQALACELPRK
jgi:hypothetical protein